MPHLSALVPFTPRTPQVRSFRLDRMKASIFEAIDAIGNTRSNAVYEANIEAPWRKITPQSTRGDREAFIRAKYVDKAFCLDDQTSVEPVTADVAEAATGASLRVPGLA